MELRTKDARKFVPRPSTPVHSVWRHDLHAGMVRTRGRLPNSPSVGLPSLRLRVRNNGPFRAAGRDLTALASKAVPRTDARELAGDGCTLLTKPWLEAARSSH